MIDVVDWLSQLAEKAESEAKRLRQKLSLLTLGYLILPSPRLSCPRHGRASVGRLFPPLGVCPAFASESFPMRLTSQLRMDYGEYKQEWVCIPWWFVFLERAVHGNRSFWRLQNPKNGDVFVVQLVQYLRYAPSVEVETQTDWDQSAPASSGARLERTNELMPPQKVRRAHSGNRAKARSPQQKLKVPIQLQ